MQNGDETPQKLRKIIRYRTKSLSQCFPNTIAWSLAAQSIPKDILTAIHFGTTSTLTLFLPLWNFMPTGTRIGDKINPTARILRMASVLVDPPPSVSCAP